MFIDHKQDWQLYPVDPYSAVCFKEKSDENTYTVYGTASAEHLDHTIIAVTVD